MTVGALLGLLGDQPLLALLPLGELPQLVGTVMSCCDLVMGQPGQARVSVIILLRMP